MPDMDGLKVVEAIRRIDPGIPIIVASGFMFNGECSGMPGFEVMAAEAGAVHATLYKPLRPMKCCKRSASGRRRHRDRARAVTKL